MRYVPRNLALELKHLGFDEMTDVWNQRGDGVSGDVMGNRDYYNRKGDVYTALPTYSQAFDWFREKHDLHCFIDFDNPKFNAVQRSSSFVKSCDTYEEAEVACLETLIKIVKEKVTAEQKQSVTKWLEQEFRKLAHSGAYKLGMRDIRVTQEMFDELFEQAHQKFQNQIVEADLAGVERTLLDISKFPEFVGDLKAPGAPLSIVDAIKKGLDTHDNGIEYYNKTYGSVNEESKD